MKQTFTLSAYWVKSSENETKHNKTVTVHVDLLAQLYQLHLCWHVSHRPHAVPQVFAPNESIFVFVKLFECFTQLWEQIQITLKYLKKC